MSPLFPFGNKVSKLTHFAHGKAKQIRRSVGCRASSHSGVGFSLPYCPASGIILPDTEADT